MAHHLKVRLDEVMRKLARAPGLPNTPMNEWTDDDLCRCVAFGLWNSMDAEYVERVRAMTDAELAIIANGRHPAAPLRPRV